MSLDENLMSRVFGNERISLYRQELQFCSLRDFVEKIVVQVFGMGHDYAMRNEHGEPMKAWFTINEAIEASKNKGFELNEAQAKQYLEALVSKKYFEYFNGQYRRRVFLPMRDL